MEIYINSKKEEEGEKETDLFLRSQPQILYSNTNNIHITAILYNYKSKKFIYEQLNLREILNLYITDGFFKQSSNYMKSILNSAELINLSRYMVYKIKTSTF